MKLIWRCGSGGWRGIVRSGWGPIFTADHIVPLYAGEPVEVDDE